MGGQENLREKPFLIHYAEPISPLVVPDEVADRIFLAADRFLPQMMGPKLKMLGILPGFYQSRKHRILILL